MLNIMMKSGGCLLMMMGICLKCLFWRAFRLGFLGNVLNKRENFRRAFDGFDYKKIACYGDEKVEELKNDSGIIRNRLKICACIENAKVFMEIQREFGSFNDYIWHFTGGEQVVNLDDNFKTTSKLSDEVSKDLQKRGMRFVGSTIIYSYLQAIGVIDDHELNCDFRKRKNHM